ncbi:hypothetical protein NDU88_005574 [Pleurodeles waltl]|uniref:Uncharacterized protein n=1 Tax=Pleurodeles waltl TaxID=8319 RepID=A0AAV7MX61_PLEWA|nr:hypothetical protein NDU88_005574 [Pleurodeles waltl]
MALLLLHQLTIFPGLRPHPPRRRPCRAASTSISSNYSPQPGQQKQNFQAFTCRSGPCALSAGHLPQDTAQPGHTYHDPSLATPPRADRTADREPHPSVLGKAPSLGAQRQAGAASLPPLHHIRAPPPVQGPGMGALEAGPTRHVLGPGPQAQRHHRSPSPSPGPRQAPPSAAPGRPRHPHPPGRTTRPSPPRSLPVRGEHGPGPKGQMLQALRVCAWSPDPLPGMPLVSRLPRRTGGGPEDSDLGSRCF